MAHSGESARLPPMCPGFHSRTWRHIWAEFVHFGSLPCSQRFFSCLVPRPHYYALVIRFGSRGPREKCGLDKNLKSETICLTFSQSRFRLAGGNSLSISGRGTAREKHFKLLTIGLMLSGQVQRPIWIQTGIYGVRSIADFKLQFTSLETFKYRSA